MTICLGQQMFPCEIWKCSVSQSQLIWIGLKAFPTLMISLKCVWDRVDAAGLSRHHYAIPSFNTPTAPDQKKIKCACKKVKISQKPCIVVAYACGINNLFSVSALTRLQLVEMCFCHVIQSLEPEPDISGSCSLSRQTETHSFPRPLTHPSPHHHVQFTQSEERSLSDSSC